MSWSKGKIFKVVWVLAGISFMAWMFINMQAKDVDDAILQSGATTEVKETKDFFSFTPKQGYEVVFIFYPGALVQTEAYAPLCRKIADHGIRALLIKMPFRMATRGYNKPKELNLFSDTSKQYILSGHSQGAKMAAQFVYENPGLVDKLILIGTTHPRDIDLSNISIPVMKIYGSNDGVASVQEIDRNKPKLPADTKYVLLRGANHSQFAYYGYQLGDNKASIPRPQQQEEILEQVLSFAR